MTSNWGDDIDEELQNEEKIKVGFMWNFISMNHMVANIDQEVGERDGNYPKSELMKIWGTAMLIIQILGIFSHNIILIATMPFIFFYALLFFKISGVLKRFKYSVAGYWVLTVLLLIVIAAISLVVQHFLFGIEL